MKEKTYYSKLINIISRELSKNFDEHITGSPQLSTMISSDCYQILKSIHLTERQENILEQTDLDVLGKRIAGTVTKVNSWSGNFRSTGLSKIYCPSLNYMGGFHFGIFTIPILTLEPDDARPKKILALLAQQLSLQANLEQLPDLLATSPLMSALRKPRGYFSSWIFNEQNTSSFTRHACQIFSLQCHIHLVAEFLKTYIPNEIGIRTSGFFKPSETLGLRLNRQMEKAYNDISALKNNL